MRINDLLWKVDLWLLQFEGEVDAHFGAGNIERGLSAYRLWHDQVRRGIASIDERLAQGFAKTARNISTETDSATKATPRTVFMRNCGSPSTRFLKEIKKRALNGTLTLGSET